MDPRIIEVDGLATHVHISGSGDPVLLLHGSGPGATAYANWRLTMPVLAREHTVIAPDLVGFGQTPAPDGYVFSRDAWVDHALGVLDALGVDRVDVVGNSYGGAIALGLAIRAPQRVRRLVLMGSVGVPFAITDGLAAVWGYEPSVAAMDALVRLFAYDPGLVNDDLVAMRYAASIEPGIHESYSRMFPSPRQACVDAAAFDDATLATITQRTLIIHGRDDRIIPMTTSLHLHRVISDSQLHVFGRCGHWTQIERADEFTRLVSDFLR
jgi:2-hydroxymuconate-semialdehyde hydrolase